MALVGRNENDDFGETCTSPQNLFAGTTLRQLSFSMPKKSESSLIFGSDEAEPLEMSVSQEPAGRPFAHARRKALITFRLPSPLVAARAFATFGNLSNPELVESSLTNTRTENGGEH